MPIKEKIKKVLVIGSGPIIIGQAAEFDYSGTQACKVLKEEDIKVVLVNSNPATIMTDKEIADAVYIEPLTVEVIEKIILKEKPDSIMAGMGGQIALNLAVELNKKGIIQKYGLKLLGTDVESIDMAEDREKFKGLMERIGEPVIESQIVNNMEEAVEYSKIIGFPLVVRPAFTLGGSGGGIANDIKELREIASKGLKYSMVNQVLLEKSVKGWKEIEYEMMRDNKGNAIAVCNMENIDPVGVHTGDSIVVAPSQTLSDKEYQMLRNASIKIIDALNIKGGCNVQFALDPNSFEYHVIEVNPRVSRSSALASKATGYPIAKVAAKIAIGYNLDEIKNDVTGKTFACFEPTLDYCVVKIPKWPFDKFKTGNRALGTKMMATGEVMAIANNFESALLKGVRSLEIGQYNLYNKDLHELSIEELKEKIKLGDDERLFYIAEMFRRGLKIKEISFLTGIDKFYLDKIKNIVDLEESIRNTDLSSIDENKMLLFKKKGFSDKGMAILTNTNGMEVYELRKKYNIEAVYKMVDTCGGEFDAASPYYYSTYDRVDEVEISQRDKVMVIGSGPIRIGQGIEFDYCSVHGVLALKEEGIESIIVNNNPETVSTDFDTSDKLYFEPLTEEDVLNIIEKEKPKGVILQYGGQTSIKLAKFLDKMDVDILGSSAESIDKSEDREKFEKLLDELDIKRPKGKGVMTLEEGLKVSEQLGYPVLVRPSYVLGGMGMEIAYNKEELEKYLEDVFKRDSKNPVLIDKYMMGLEIEVDAICDGEDILIPGIMEHLERAGVHSGDSISIYPAENICKEIENNIVEYTYSIAKALNIKGLINIQYVLYENQLYVIEVNPRASRTVPYISKVTGIPMISLATKIMLGKKLKDLGYGTGLNNSKKIKAVKVPVFSMEKLPDTEVALGPEMKSTGEVLGVGEDLDTALYKGLIGAGINISRGGKVIISISDNYKEEFLPIAMDLKNLGFHFFATEGTERFLRENKIEATKIGKIGEDDNSLLNLIDEGEIDLVVNIPTKGRNSRTDGFKIRRRAVEKKVCCLTSLDTLAAIIDIIKKDIKIEDLEVINICEI
ncbi:carbamoyl-phosphate synthase large subunit [Paramaledivibacter caminithermalis]|jgi:carbamoyl-phosphate synthase large subunit|uniref:Carbamoyl phosphate synthase large chain n=1 Tax=Paramaledivibacter caminithermalis (strain DSM 15212 / CIP 107654 / DViRD3) TaxID=1121301 RepID=A0A1M6LP51_PARC5|nr:carbamoyl-phosphate synthase large subunit [Paramaledivibacter caminithermalis]SHJ72945.1 carbamoyl-phosphate synthase large subunit [Paramaledivibacter caminithermalis DSM 15212]